MATSEIAQTPNSKSILKPLLDIAFAVAVVAVVFAAVLYADLQFYGVRFYEVTTSSMSGTFEKGDVVGVRSVAPHTVEKNDVIAFTRPNFSQPIIHRVQYVGNPLPDIQTLVKDKQGKVIKENWQFAHRDFYTKGDANPEPDPGKIPEENLIGKVLFAVPHPFQLLVSGLEKSTLLAIGVGSIALFIIWEIFDGLKKAVNRKSGEVDR